MDKVSIDNKFGLLRTPFYESHIQRGARMVPFSGWEMPVSYEGILEEHMAVRSDKGLFDVSHMGEFRLTGPDSGEFLDYLLTNRISGTPVGKAVYSPMCDETGGVVDDCIVYRLGEEDLLIVVNAANQAKDFAWMSGKIGSFQVSLVDESSDWALLALQGPSALSTLMTKGWDLASLPRFGCRKLTVGGLEVICSRTGYTGEDGVEIFIPSADASGWLAQIFPEEEQRWIGLGARDSLRLEAGLPLYGHEMSAEINPLEAGFGWTVRFEKDDFLGREPLWQCKQSQEGKRVRFFKVEDRRIAREGSALYDANGQPLGRVLSGSQSPVLQAPIGSALLETKNWVDVAEVDVRGKRFPVTFLKPPLQKWTKQV